MNMIRVNGVKIGDDAVAREMQHHPAPSRDEAERQAATALVVRELLLQRVREREIGGATEDERIANLIEAEIKVPEPRDEEVARYYRRNSLQFTSPAIYRAAHIFFPARASNEAARSVSRSGSPGPAPTRYTVTAGTAPEIGNESGRQDHHFHFFP